MPILDSYARLPLDQIVINRDHRQRKEIEVDDLLPSIKEKGVLVPIIVETVSDGRHWLIAGERRLTASLKLGLPDIPVRFSKDLSPVEAKIIELEENIKRKDLPWQDLVEATAEIHSLFLSRDQHWTMAETAEAIGISQGTVSMYLSVQKQMTDAKIQTSGTVREAYNTISRRDQRKAGVMLQELLDVAPGDEDFVENEEDQVEGEALIEEGDKTAGAVDGNTGNSPSSPAASVQAREKAKEPEAIIRANFLDWAPQYAGPKFNLLHCDFPYGIGVFEGPQMSSGEDKEAYDDSAEAYWSLLDCFVGNLDRFASHAFHLMFWYSEQHGQKTREKLLSIPGLVLIPHPLIWGKTDNSGVASDAKRRPRHIYETCLLGYRGDRNLVQTKGDFYGAPTDKALHQSTKPEPMLRHFMSMLVDETSSVLDPTCGSGAALRAADSLNASRVLGLDIKEEYVERALQAFKTSRALRRAA